MYDVRNPFIFKHIRAGIVQVSYDARLTEDLGFVMRLLPPPGHVIITSFVYIEVGWLSSCEMGYLAIFSSRHASRRVKTETDRLCEGVEYDNPQVYAVEALYLYLGGNNM